MLALHGCGRSSCRRCLLGGGGGGCMLASLGNVPITIGEKDDICLMEALPAWLAKRVCGEDWQMYLLHGTDAAVRPTRLATVDVTSSLRSPGVTSWCITQGFRNAQLPKTPPPEKETRLLEINPRYHTSCPISPPDRPTDPPQMQKPQR